MKESLSKELRRHDFTKLEHPFLSAFYTCADNVKGAVAMMVDTIPYVREIEVRHPSESFDKAFMSPLYSSSTIKQSLCFSEISCEQEIVCGSILSSHGASIGRWYYEVEILDVEDGFAYSLNGQIRIGWAQRCFALNSPIGSNIFSIGMSCSDGVIHCDGLTYAVLKPSLANTRFEQRHASVANGTPWLSVVRKGDVIGCFMEIPLSPQCPLIHNKDIPLDSALLEDPLRMHHPFPSSTRFWYTLNGEASSPVMQLAVSEGAYHPAISISRRGRVKVNLGPHFKYLSSNTASNSDLNLRKLFRPCSRMATIVQVGATTTVYQTAVGRLASVLRIARRIKSSLSIINEGDVNEGLVSNDSDAELLRRKKISLELLVGAKTLGIPIPSMIKVLDRYTTFTKSQTWLDGVSDDLMMRVFLFPNEYIEDGWQRSPWSPSNIEGAEVKEAMHLKRFRHEISIDNNHAHTYTNDFLLPEDFVNEIEDGELPAANAIPTDNSIKIDEFIQRVLSFPHPLPASKNHAGVPQNETLSYFPKSAGDALKLVHSLLVMRTGLHAPLPQFVKDQVVLWFSHWQRKFKEEYITKTAIQQVENVDNDLCGVDLTEDERQQIHDDFTSLASLLAGGDPSIILQMDAALKAKNNLSNINNKSNLLTYIPEKGLDKSTRHPKIIPLLPIESVLKSSLQKEIAEDQLINENSFSNVKGKKNYKNLISELHTYHQNKNSSSEDSLFHNRNNEQEETLNSFKEGASSSPTSSSSSSSTENNTLTTAMHNFIQNRSNRRRNTLQGLKVLPEQNSLQSEDYSEDESNTSCDSFEMSKPELQKKKRVVNSVSSIQISSLTHAENSAANQATASTKRIKIAPTLSKQQPTRQRKNTIMQAVDVKSNKPHVNSAPYNSNFSHFAPTSISSLPVMNHFRGPLNLGSFVGHFQQQHFQQQLQQHFKPVDFANTSSIASNTNTSNTSQIPQQQQQQQQVYYNLNQISQPSFMPQQLFYGYGAPNNQYPPLKQQHDKPQNQ